MSPWEAHTAGPSGLRSSAGRRRSVRWSAPLVGTRDGAKSKETAAELCVLQSQDSACYSYSTLCVTVTGLCVLQVQDSVCYSHRTLYVTVKKPTERIGMGCPRLFWATERMGVLPSGIVRAESSVSSRHLYQRPGCWLHE